MSKPITNIKSKFNKDEYIKTLELSIKILQQEIDELKEKITENKISIAIDNDENQVVSLLTDFIKINNIHDLRNLTIKFFINLDDFYETEIYEFDAENNIKPIYFDEIYESFYDNIKELEESGIVSWVINSREFKIIDFDDNSNKDIHLLIYPIFNEYKNILIFSKLSYEFETFPDSIKKNLKEFENGIDVSLSNIYNPNNNAYKIESQKALEQNLSLLEKISKSVFEEIIQFSNIILANSNLVQSGIGDIKTRNKIIMEKSESIREISSKYIDLQNFRINNSTNLMKIIEEIVFFLNIQFQKDAVIISNSVDINFTLNLDSLILEENLIDLLIMIKDTIPEGGEITISFNLVNNIGILIFNDSGVGFDNNDVKIFNDSIYENLINKKFFNTLIKIKNNLLNNGLKFELISKEGSGTTYIIKIPN